MWSFKCKQICLCVILLTIILCSCSKEEPIEELSFRITWDKHSGRGNAIDSIVQKYNEQSTKYKVSLLSGNEDIEDITNDLNQVDVLMMPYRYIHDIDISENLLSLDSVYTSHDTFDQSMIDLATNNNELKGVPWIGHSMCLVFNTQICKDANVNPYTWSSLNDLVKGCEMVTLSTESSGLGLVGANHHDVSWMVNQFIYTFGGCLVNEANQVEIYSQESINAIEFYKEDLGKFAQDGWQDHTGVNVLELFANQEIAFEIQGPWAVTDIWKLGKPFDVGVIPLNQIGMYSEVGPIMLSVSKKSEHVDGAMDFINYLESDIALEMILNGEYSPKYDAYYPFRIPIKENIAKTGFYEKYPEFLPFAQGFKRPSISTPSSQWAEVQNNIYPMILHQIMIDELTIDEGLKEVMK